MTYQALATTLLISAPSDIPPEDMACIRLAVSQWNVSYGRVFGITIVPVSWNEHAVSEFGSRPQEIINKQLVSFADFALALFADRLGTPTGKFASGTWEEIEEVAAAGKPVSILRNVCPRPPLGGSEAAREKVRLEEHLRDVAYPSALVLQYADHAELTAHVNAMLSRVASMMQQRLTDDNQSGSGKVRGNNSGVWPRIETNEYPETDKIGRINIKRRHHLVLSNMTGNPAMNVRYAFDAGEGRIFATRSDNEPIQTLAPGGEARFSLVFSMGSAAQANCKVTWVDDDGGEHSCDATVRR